MFTRLTFLATQHTVLAHYSGLLFYQVAKSRDVEVLEGKTQYLEFAGNLIPVTKSGDQLAFNFYAFRENRLPFTVRVKDPNAESVGRVAFMRQPKVRRKSLVRSFPVTANSLCPTLDLNAEVWSILGNKNGLLTL